MIKLPTTMAMLILYSSGFGFVNCKKTWGEVMGEGVGGNWAGGGGGGGRGTVMSHKNSYVYLL